MADRILFITWKAPVRGLEERAVESFNDAIGLYGRMQQEGRIESFDVALLNLTGDLGGYLQLNGTAQQLADELEGVRHEPVVRTAWGQFSFCWDLEGNPLQLYESAYIRPDADPEARTE